MILRRHPNERGTPLGSPELVRLAPRLGVTGAGRNRQPSNEAEDNPLARPGITRCCWCKRFRHVGSLDDGHLALAEHRATKHPDRVVPKRKHRKKRTWQQIATRTLDDNIAGVRAQGGAAWDTDAT